MFPKVKIIFRIIAIVLCFLLCFEQSGFAQVAGQLDISGYITGLRNALTVDKFRPLHLRYLDYNPELNNFKLLLDKGDWQKGLSPKGTVPKKELEEQTKTLLNYFFVGVSLPNESFWVNLRPDSPDNIIDDLLAKTDVGKILLEADLQLKKDTAQATSPETLEGKEYWDKLYKKAEEIFGTQNVTIPTLTRPWIVPDEIIIRETESNAYIYKATLKVLLEQDYLKDSAVYNFKDERLKELNEYSSQLIRELIIPKLTKEINTAKRYAGLRQVYYSLILAQWFKDRFYGKSGLYAWLINKQNLTGLTSKESWSKNTYFQAYQKSFKEGEYNYKAPAQTIYGQTIRSYFSGGIAFSAGLGAGAGIIDAINNGVVPGNQRRSEPPCDPKKIIGISFEGGNAQDPSEIKKVTIIDGSFQTDDASAEQGQPKQILPASGSRQFEGTTEQPSHPEQQKAKFLSAGINPFIAIATLFSKKTYFDYLNDDGSTKWGIVWQDVRGGVAKLFKGKNAERRAKEISDDRGFGGEDKAVAGEEQEARKFILSNGDNIFAGDWEIPEAIEPFRALTEQYGYLPWMQLYKAAGKNVGYLFQYGLPVLKETFTSEELQAYWPCLVELGKAAGENAYDLFLLGLPALKYLIHSREDLRVIGNNLVEIGEAAGEETGGLFKFSLPAFKYLIHSREDLRVIGNDLVELGKAAGENAFNLFRNSLPALKPLIHSREDLRVIGNDLVELGKAAGENAACLFQSNLLALKQTFTSKELKTYWPDLVELGKAAGKNAYYLLLDGLPALKETFTSKELKTYWPDLVELGKVAGENALYLFELGLPTLKRIIHSREDLRIISNDLIELGKAAGKNVGYLFQYGLPVLKPLIHSREDLNNIGGELIRVLQLCEGVERETAQALFKLSGLVARYPSSWKDFIKPIIYNQTQGTFLCLRATETLARLGAIKSAEDLNFLKDFILKQGIRAYDLLENFLITGIAKKAISKPISKEKDLINEFLANVPYPIIEIYQAYKQSPQIVNELKSRAENIHKKILEGNAAEVENDPFFSAMLMYVFPPAVTTQREQYLNLYRSRPDRPKDTKAIPAALQGKPLEVSTGRYILKDASRPLDETAWQTILKVIQEINQREKITFSQEEIIALGKELLENWQKGSVYSRREDLLRKLYIYFRASRAQQLPDNLATLKNIMGIKQFLGDTLRDLIAECIARYKEADAQTYEVILAKMFKAKIENPKAAAKQVAGIIKGSKANPEQTRQRIGKALRIEDETTLEGLWEKIKDKETPEEIASILTDLAFKVQPGKEATVISHQLQGSDYKAMQSEVSAKYEFKETQEKLKLKFIVSKRKAHGVAGLNMGVCIAPDEQLWNTPNFMNVIIFDENNIARGGMHLLVIKDGGKKYLVLPGINPSTSLLTQVASDDIFNQLISYAAEIAEALNCQAVLIPKDATIHSNRSEIQRVIAAKNYRSIELSKIHPFSYAPGYSFQSCLVAVELRQAFESASDQPSPFGKTGLDESERPRFVAKVGADGKIHFEFDAGASEEFKNWNSRHEKIHLGLDQRFPDASLAAKEIAAVALAFQGVTGTKDDHLKALLLALNQNPERAPPLTDEAFLTQIAQFLIQINPALREQILAEQEKIINTAKDIIHKETDLNIHIEETNFIGSDKSSWEKYKNLLIVAEEIVSGIPKEDLLEMLKKIYGLKSLGRDDLSRDVYISYFAAGTHKHVFKLRFIRNDGSKMEMPLAVKQEIKPGDIRSHELQNLKRLNGRGVPRFGYTSTAKDGRVWYVEEFIEGKTAKELNAAGGLTEKIRRNIVSVLLSIAVSLNGMTPRDIHGANFVIRKGTEEAVMVDIGDKRLQILGKSALDTHRILFLGMLMSQYGYRNPDNPQQDHFIFDAIANAKQLEDKEGLQLIRLAYEKLSKMNRDEIVELFYTAGRNMFWNLGAKPDNMQPLIDFTELFMKSITSYLAVASSPASDQSLPFGEADEQSGVQRYIDIVHSLLQEELEDSSFSPTRLSFKNKDFGAQLQEVIRFLNSQPDSQEAQAIIAKFMEDLVQAQVNLKEFIRLLLFIKKLSPRIQKQIILINPELFISRYKEESQLWEQMQVSPILRSASRSCNAGEQEQLGGLLIERFRATPESSVLRQKLLNLILYFNPPISFIQENVESIFLEGLRHYLRKLAPAQHKQLGFLLAHLKKMYEELQKRSDRSKYVLESISYIKTEEAFNFVKEKNPALLINQEPAKALEYFKTEFERERAPSFLVSIAKIRFNEEREPALEYAMEQSSIFLRDSLKLIEGDFKAGMAAYIYALEKDGSWGVNYNMLLDVEGLAETIAKTHALGNIFYYLQYGDDFQKGIAYRALVMRLEAKPSGEEVLLGTEEMSALSLDDFSPEQRRLYNEYRAKVIASRSRPIGKLNISGQAVPAFLDQGLIYDLVETVKSWQGLTYTSRKVAYFVFGDRYMGFYLSSGESEAGVKGTWYPFYGIQEERKGNKTEFWIKKGSKLERNMNELTLRLRALLFYYYNLNPIGLGDPGTAHSFRDFMELDKKIRNEIESKGHAGFVESKDERGTLGPPSPFGKADEQTPAGQGASQQDARGSGGENERAGEISDQELANFFGFELTKPDDIDFARKHVVRAGKKQILFRRASVGTLLSEGLHSKRWDVKRDKQASIDTLRESVLINGLRWAIKVGSIDGMFREGEGGDPFISTSKSFREMETLHGELYERMRHTEVLYITEVPEGRLMLDMGAETPERIVLFPHQIPIEWIKKVVCSSLTASSVQEIFTLSDIGLILELNLTSDQRRTIEQRNKIIADKMIILEDVSRESVLKALEEWGIETGSPAASETSAATPKDGKGGIDFRALPIVTQPMQPPLGTVPLERVPFSSGGDSPLLDKEWREIENMLNGGIIPSTQRIKEYLEASCEGPDCAKRIEKVLSCIADILRLEEERCCSTEQSLKEFLVLLESDKSGNELRAALSKIDVLPKEPILIEE
jgi:hypothetical protein